MKAALVGKYGDDQIATGPERVARELFSQLKSKHQQIIFIEYYFSPYSDSTLYKKIFGNEYSNNNSIIRLGVIPLLLFFIKNKFDIIHIVNSQRFILFLLFLKPLFSGKILTTLHGFMGYELPKKNYLLKRYFIDLWVEKLIVKKSELLIFPSKLLFDTFNKHYKITQKKYQIIPNGVSKIFWNRATSFPHFENSIKLVFYNGFNDGINRGLDKLLDLMNNLKCEVVLFVIGDKIEVKTQKNIKIYFADPMSHAEIIKFIIDKHFIIKSSVYDTFPIIVAECMTLGLIPIINENIGIKDIIEHGKNGFVYNSSSSNELSELMNEIYYGKYDLNLISANTKETSKKLNWEKITEEYISAYKSIL